VKIAKLVLQKSSGLMVAALILAACNPALAIRRVTHHHLQMVRMHHGRFHRLFWNPVFRPSHESLLRQNEEIDRMELPRIQNEEQLEEFKASGALVPINASETLRFDPRLAEDRRYCRPWTRDFVDDLSQAYYKQFHDQIQVNSAVRTVQIQKKLRRHNRNAAPETGETASSHLAGITVDLQRRGMSKAQVKWMEAYLMPLHDAGVIEPEEERHQWVFHIAVSDRYLDWRDGKLSMASTSVTERADSASASDDSSAPLLSASPAFSWEQPSNAWYQEVSTPREP
jgi:uncharacterized protein YcbK (DUF882 family)